MMYESVDVVGLNPSPNPFLMMDYYNQSRGCLIPEKGLVPGAPHPYSTSIRNQHWNGSNHCRCSFFNPPPRHLNFISLIGEVEPSLLVCVHYNPYISYFALPSTRRSHVKLSLEGLFILELPLQLFKPHNMCSTALLVITISKPSLLQQAYIYLTHFLLSRFFLSVRSGLGFFPPLSFLPVCLRSDPGHATRSFCVPEICT